MNCGHPVKQGSSYKWLLVLLVSGIVSILAIGIYRVFPVVQQTLTSTIPTSGDGTNGFGVASLPKSSAAVASLPPDGRQPTKGELSRAAQRLDAAAVPYWNHVYKIDRIYYYPTDNVLHIDYLVREEFEDVDKSMLRETHRTTFCTAAAYSIFRYGDVIPQWSFRADSDKKLQYSFKILTC